MKFGSMRPSTVKGTIRVKKAFAPCRLYSCLWWRKPPITREPNHAVEHDHHDAEHRVASQRGLALAGEHDRGNHHHFDANDGERQDQRSQRLSEPHRQALRMVHHGEGRAHDDGEKPNEHQGEPQRIGQIGQPAFAKQQKQCRSGEGRSKSHSRRRVER